MIHLTHWLSSALVGDIGWTLIHFLWQGGALAALLYVLLPVCRNARARHDCALGVLIAMGLAPVATFVILHAHGDGSGALISASTSLPRDAFLGGTGQPAAIRFAWAAWLVVFWLCGVAGLSVRAIGGWFLIRTWRYRDTVPVPEEFLSRCHALQKRLALTRPIRYLQSRRITVPMVIGWFKPVVLVPVSAITGLPPQQLDALILHELAHIARLDAFANVAQVAVETILFYHPAVWWVGRQVRAEREHCCDDIAASACGDVTTYVEALISLEAGRETPVLSLAANGGKLKHRVRRLLNPAETRRSSLSAFIGLALFGLVLATAATAEIAAPAAHQTVSIRVVDEDFSGDRQNGPQGEDRVQVAAPGAGEPQALWLKREGQISGNVVAEAHVVTGYYGRPVIAFTFTPEAAAKFQALTRDNVGRRLAIVVDNRVIAAPFVKEPILGGSAQIDGKFASDDAARAMIAEMLGTKDAR